MLSTWSVVKAQTSTCMDMSQIANLPGDLNDDVVYPAGTVLYSDAEMEVKKTYPSTGSWWHSTVSYGVSSILFDYGGWLTLDVSKTTCTNRTITIEAICEYLVVDEDTLLTNDVKNSDYYGAGFSVKYASAVFTISGDFDEILIGGGTSRLYSICSNTGNCLATGFQDEQKISTELASVYPNPTDGDVFIDLGHSNGLVQIYNAVGTLVYASQLSASGLLTVSDLGASGMYFVQVTQNGKTHVTKVVKK